MSAVGREVEIPIAEKWPYIYGPGSMSAMAMLRQLTGPKDVTWLRLFKMQFDGGVSQKGPA
jgi:hypothetical protein